MLPGVPTLGSSQGHPEVRAMGVRSARPVRGRAIRLEEGADMESGTPQGAVLLWPVLNIYRGANDLVHIYLPRLEPRRCKGSIKGGTPDARRSNFGVAVRRRLPDALCIGAAARASGPLRDKITSS